MKLFLLTFFHLALGLCQNKNISQWTISLLSHQCLLKQKLKIWYLANISLCVWHCHQILRTNHTLFLLSVKMCKPFIGSSVYIHSTFKWLQYCHVRTNRNLTHIWFLYFVPRLQIKLNIYPIILEQLVRHSGNPQFKEVSGKLLLVICVRFIPLSSSSSSELHWNHILQQLFQLFIPNVYHLCWASSSAQSLSPMGGVTKKKNEKENNREKSHKCHTQSNSHSPFAILSALRMKIA